MIGKADFIAQYIDASEIDGAVVSPTGFICEDVEFTAAPCDCGDSSCEGWEMSSHVLNEAAGTFIAGTWVSRPAPILQVQMQPQEVRINNTCETMGLTKATLR